MNSWRPTLQIRDCLSSAFKIDNKISEGSSLQRKKEDMDGEGQESDPMTLEQRKQAILNNTMRMQVEKFAAKPNRTCCRVSYEKAKQSSPQRVKES